MIFPHTSAYKQFRFPLISRWLPGVCLFGAIPLLATSMAWGQETGRGGQSSLTLVNALPGPQNLYVKFGEKDIWPAGFASGQSTGAVLFPSGKKKVQLTCMGFATTLEEISLPPGGNFAMVFFPGEEIKDGPDKGKKKISLFCPPPILPNQAPQGKTWNALLAGSVDRVKLNLNGQPVEMHKGEPIKVDGKEGKMVVESGGRMLLGASPEGEGNYWVILFGDKEESIQAVLLNHLVYSVPQ